MRIKHTTRRGGTEHSVTLLIDPEDERLYRRSRWSITTQGLVQPYTSKRLARLIAKASLAEVVSFRDGNRFNVQRSNLVLRPSKRGAYVRDLSRRSNRRVPRKSREAMRGVYFIRDRRGAMTCRAIAQVKGRQVARTFSPEQKFGPEVNGKLGRSEAYRRAVCWRIGTLLTQGHVPDERSMEIFWEEHPRLCPFRRSYMISREKDGTYYASLEAGGKRHTRSFSPSSDQESALRRAVLWTVGTLFATELLPDEGSVKLLKKTIAFWNAAPEPSEMYAGNAEYRGNRAYLDRDEDLAGLEQDDVLSGEEEHFNTRSVPLGSDSYYG